MTPDSGAPNELSAGRPIDRVRKREIEAVRETVSQSAAIAALEAQVSELQSYVERLKWAMAGLSPNKSLLMLEEKGRQRLATHLPTGERERLLRVNAAASFDEAVAISRDHA